MSESEIPNEDRCGNFTKRDRRPGIGHDSSFPSAVRKVCTRRKTVDDTFGTIQGTKAIQSELTHIAVREARARRGSVPDSDVGRHWVGLV